MNLTFKYTEREFRSAMNQSQGDVKRIYFDVILAIALFSYGIYLTLNNSNEVFSALLIVISLMYIFLLIAKMYIVPKLIFRREPKFFEEYSLSFQDDEINFKAGNIKSTLPWTYYIGMKESRDFIFLIYGKKRYTIIPKRVFKGNNEINEFKDLVKAKINKQN